MFCVLFWGFGLPRFPAIVPSLSPHCPLGCPLKNGQAGDCEEVVEVPKIPFFERR